MKFRLPAITALTAVALLTAACQDEGEVPEAEETESGSIIQPQELNDEGKANETAMATGLGGDANTDPISETN